MSRDSGQHRPPVRPRGSAFWTCTPRPLRSARTRMPFAIMGYTCLAIPDPEVLRSRISRSRHARPGLHPAGDRLSSPPIMVIGLRRQKAPTGDGTPAGAMKHRTLARGPTWMSVPYARWSCRQERPCPAESRPAPRAVLDLGARRERPVRLQAVRHRTASLPTRAPRVVQAAGRPDPRRSARSTTCVSSGIACDRSI